jgi:hypothetical protein
MSNTVEPLRQLVVIAAAAAAATAAAAPLLPPPLDDLCGEWQVRETGFGYDSVGRVGPPLASLRGSGLASSANVLPIGALTFPPYVVGTSSYHVEGPPLTDPQRPGHGEPGFPDPLTGYTGRLAINGTLVAPDRSRWCAHKVERAAAVVVGGVELLVLTTVSLAAESRAVFFGVEISAAAAGRSGNGFDDNGGGGDGSLMTFEVTLEMQGVVRMYNRSTDWQFGHNTTFANETSVDVAPGGDGGDFVVSALPGGLGVAVADARPVCGGAATAFLLSEAPAALELAPQVVLPPSPSSSSEPHLLPPPATRTSAERERQRRRMSASSNTTNATTTLPGGRATYHWSPTARAQRPRAAAAAATPTTTAAAPAPAPPPFRVGVVLGVAAGVAEALAVATALVDPGGGGAQGFAAGIAAAQAAWQERWDAAFTPTLDSGSGGDIVSNHSSSAYFSGHLPVFFSASTTNDATTTTTTTTTTSARTNTTTAGEDLARIYYWSVASFLSIQRLVEDTHTETAFTRAYATGGPRTGVTTLYFWDMPYQVVVGRWGLVGTRWVTQWGVCVGGSVWALAIHRRRGFSWCCFFGCS